MRDLKRVKKVEKMINEIKAMNLSLPEKMYYVYTLFLEDFTEEMKGDLRATISLRHDLKKFKKKKGEKAEERVKEIEKELFDMGREKVKTLPNLIERIKGEVTEYAENFESEKWTQEEEEKRTKEAKTIEKIKKQITEK